MLGGQIAISIENAKLYGNLERALDKQVELTQAYSRFTPKAFIDFLGRDSILDVRLGDNRHGEMTVLFLDIRGYTSLSEKMTPAENFRFINGFLRRMTPHIAACSGVVQDFLGDGLMAFFPGNPADAVKACIDMQSAVREYSTQREREGREPISVGMGLHTGPLMIGVVGDQDRMDTALVSDTVNTAARMEGLTKIFEVNIVASESTIAGSENVATRRIGDVRVVGKSTVYRVYDIFAGDDPDVVSAKTKTAEHFAAGLDLFQAGKFAESATTFEEVLAIDAHDRTARGYLERSVKHVVDGAPDRWSGVVTLDSKS